MQRQEMRRQQNLRRVKTGREDQGKKKKEATNKKTNDRIDKKDHLLLYPPSSTPDTSFLVALPRSFSFYILI